MSDKYRGSEARDSIEKTNNEDKVGDNGDMGKIYCLSVSFALEGKSVFVISTSI